LRETRQGLRKLARKSVTHVRDSKILLGGFDKNKDPIFLKFTINKVRDLMIETLESLKEAKEKYNSAIETFGNLNHSIKIQNKQLTNLLTNVNDTKALLDSEEIIFLKRTNNDSYNCRHIRLSWNLFRPSYSYPLCWNYCNGEYPSCQ